MTSDPEIEPLLAEAFALHRAGRIIEAEQWYEYILAISPNDLDAQHMLGIIRAERGRTE